MRVVLTPGMGIGPEVTARALVEIGDVAAMTLIGDGEAIGRRRWMQWPVYRWWIRAAQKAPPL